jgi:ubiquinone/menaquinone biosynthesis C-methylase UbiE
MNSMNNVNHHLCPCTQKARILLNNNKYYCENKYCNYSLNNGGFNSINGIPILINFEKCDTVCTKIAYEKLKSIYIRRADSYIYKKLKNLVYGNNTKTIRNCNLFINKLKILNKKSKVLIIGSGTIGQGSESLYASENLMVTGIDIYPSLTVDFIADSHYLPFKDSVFDGVWIQAVLEHVVDPVLVVSEIHRVLISNGIVYSEAPFMQHIHEGAYDFFRFTGSAHRGLFREFNLIDIGVVGGSATAFAWSLRHLVQSLFNCKKLAIVLSIPFIFFGRILDKFIKKNNNWDGASATYFMGEKNNISISHKEILQIYTEDKEN